jgi:hypothetical protein
MTCQAAGALAGVPDVKKKLKRKKRTARTPAP